jgi:hypothetical protein
MEAEAQFEILPPDSSSKVGDASTLTPEQMRI